MTECLHSALKMGKKCSIKGHAIILFSCGIRPKGKFFLWIIAFQKKIIGQRANNLVNNQKGKIIIDPRADNFFFVKREMGKKCNIMGYAIILFSCGIRHNTLQEKPKKVRQLTLLIYATFVLKKPKYAPAQRQWFFCQIKYYFP